MDQDAFDLHAYNRAAWDEQVRRKNQWTIPVSAAEVEQARRGKIHIVLTPCKPVPQEWLQPLQEKNILCLAGAGGQQAPLLAAAGANVTVLDNSPQQLEQDQVVARREGLSIRSVLGVMSDLSVFSSASFDLIVHPCSNLFAPNLQPVWNEAYRVLKQGGDLLSGFCNPLPFIYDYKQWEQGNLVAKHTIPMSEFDALDKSTKQEMIDRGEPFAVAHTLQDQIGGQIAAGFSITGFYEDNWPESEKSPLARFIDCFISTRARKTKT